MTPRPESGSSPSPSALGARYARDSPVWDAGMVGVPLRPGRGSRVSGVGPASGHRVRTPQKSYPVYTTGADHRPPEVPRIMNAFLYVRLSRSTDESTSVERQTAAAKEL